MREEVARLRERYGPTLVRDVVLDRVAFDPVGAPDRIAEVCMVVRRPSGKLLLAIKDFYPRGAFRLPTGGIHEGEPILDALGREAREETGLDLVPRRFLASLTYLNGARREPVFHTFAFLLDETGGNLGAIDTSERIEQWIELEPSHLPSVASTLEAIPDDANGDGIPWNAWGRFRAVVHRAVYEALSG
jgi:8-oxo-dGTP pyrophosphatase MutT (NUDIX family)